MIEPPDFDDRLTDLVRRAQVGPSSVQWDGIVSPEDALLYLLWVEEDRETHRRLGLLV